MQGVKFIYSNHAMKRFNLRFPGYNLLNEEKSLQLCNSEDLKSLQSSNSYKRAKRQNPRELRFYRSACDAYFVCRVEKVVDGVEHTKVITIIRNTKQENADYMQQLVLEMYERKLEREREAEEEEKIRQKLKKEKKANQKKKSTKKKDSSVSRGDECKNNNCSPAHKEHSLKKGTIKSTILEVGRLSEHVVFKTKSPKYIKNLNLHIKEIESEERLLNLNYLIAKNMIQARRCLMKMEGGCVKSISIPSECRDAEDGYSALIEKCIELNKNNSLFFRVLWKHMFTAIGNYEGKVEVKRNKRKKKEMEPPAFENEINSYWRVLNYLNSKRSKFQEEDVLKACELMEYEQRLMEKIYLSGKTNTEEVVEALNRLYKLENTVNKAGLKSKYKAILNFYNTADQMMFDTYKSELKFG